MGRFFVCLIKFFAKFFASATPVQNQAFEGEPVKKVSAFDDEVPDWYTWAITHRPWPMEALKVPLVDQISDVDSWSHDQLMKFINLQLGLELPRDRGITYRIPFSDDMEGEHPPVIISQQEASMCSGMVGFDQLHNALLIICGLGASSVELPRENGIGAANLIYNAATGFCVGGTMQKELDAEMKLRSYLMLPESRMNLQEAVEFVFWQFSLPHPASVEYLLAEHPPVWRW